MWHIHQVTEIMNLISSHVIRILQPFHIQQLIKTIYNIKKQKAVYWIVFFWISKVRIFKKYYLWSFFSKSLTVHNTSDLSAIKEENYIFIKPYLL